MNSWWHRGASPAQFARMSPRERVFAGLAGLSMGSSGIEVRGLGEEFTMMQTVAPVARPTMVQPIVAAQTVLQPSVQAVSQPALQPYVPSVQAVPQPALQPYVAPTAYTGGSYVAPATYGSSGPSRESPPKFATGREGGAEDVIAPEQEEVWEGTAPQANREFQKAQRSVAKAPGPSGIVNLKQETTAMAQAAPGFFGVPRWVWVVGGLSAALVVLFKVAK